MQKSENCEPEKVVMNEKRALWMRILINNIKALGIFLVMAFIVMFIVGFYGLAHGAIPEQAGYFILIGLLWTNFYAGKRFLSSTKNLLLDSASFILVIALVFYYILGFVFVGYNPSGDPLLIQMIPYFLVLLAILMQFLGMRKGIRRKNRDSA